MAEAKPKTLGQVAFESYRDALFYKSKIGKLKWEQLDKLQGPWEKCGEAVREAIEKEAGNQ